MLLAPLAPAQGQNRPGASHWSCKCLGDRKGLASGLLHWRSPNCPLPCAPPERCHLQPWSRTCKATAPSPGVILQPSSRLPDPDALGLRPPISCSLRSQYSYLAPILPLNPCLLPAGLVRGLASIPRCRGRDSPQLPPAVPSGTSAQCQGRLCQSCVEPLGAAQRGTPAPPPCTTHMEGEEAKGFPDPDPQQLTIPHPVGTADAAASLGTGGNGAPSMFHLS